MENKECYLVMMSSEEWEENVKFNTGTVFLSLLSAEKELEKQKLITQQKNHFLLISAMKKLL